MAAGGNRNSERFSEDRKKRESLKETLNVKHERMITEKGERKKERKKCFVCDVLKWSLINHQWVGLWVWEIVIKFFSVWTSRATEKRTNTEREREGKSCISVQEWTVSMFEYGYTCASKGDQIENFVVCM